MDKAFSQLTHATAKAVAQSMAGSYPPVVNTAVRGNASISEKDALIFDLQRQLDDERDKSKLLEEQIRSRVASFVQRETAAMGAIDSLEDKLDKAIASDEDFKSKMSLLRSLHGNVVTCIEDLQSGTASILQNQEKDLMRGFRSRFEEVSRELEMLRNKKGDFNAELQARMRRIVTEFHSSQELSQVLDKKNQQLIHENQRLQELFRTQKDDREALVKELVNAKREREKAREQLAQQKQSMITGIHSSAPSATAKPLSSPNKEDVTETPNNIDSTKRESSEDYAMKFFEKELKYRDAITKLQKNLILEQNKFMNLQAENQQIISSQTEMQSFLRQCLDDVKLEVSRVRKNSSYPLVPALSKVVDIDEFNKEHRESVLDMLLKQQKVIELLSDKAFPQNNTPNSSSSSGEVNNWKSIDTSDLIPRPSDHGFDDGQSKLENID